jgi:hypothetical protein
LGQHKLIAPTIVALTLTPNAGSIEMKYLATILTLSLCLSSLAGCTTINLNQSAEAKQRETMIRTKATSLREELMSKWRNSSFDIIRDKTTPDTNDITFEMLTSTKKPSKNERKALLEWAKTKYEWKQKALKWVKEVDPPEVVTVTEVAMNRGLGNFLELYHGQITYGEYHRRSKQNTTEYNEAINKIRSLYQQRHANAQAQAAAIANQQTMMFLQYLNSYNTAIQNFQIQHQPTHGTIRCYKTGMYTTCNY